MEILTDEKFEKFESEDFEEFLEEVKKMNTMKSNLTVSSSQIWNIPTLKSRRILEKDLLPKPAKSCSTPKQTPKSKSSKSLFKNAIFGCFTGQEEIEETIEDASLKTEHASAAEEVQRQRLNELRLLTLSYEAEMEDLQDEIRRLEKEKSKLQAKRFNKSYKDYTMKIKTSRQSSKASLTTPIKKSREHPGITHNDQVKLNPTESSLSPVSSPSRSIGGKSIGRISSSSGFSELSDFESNAGFLSPPGASLASVIQKNEELKILYIC